MINTKDYHSINKLAIKGSGKWKKKYAAIYYKVYNIMFITVLIKPAVTTLYVINSYYFLLYSEVIAIFSCIFILIK